MKTTKDQFGYQIDGAIWKRNNRHFSKDLCRTLLGTVREKGSKRLNASASDLRKLFSLLADTKQQLFSMVPTNEVITVSSKTLQKGTEESISFPVKNRTATYIAVFKITKYTMSFELKMRSR